ANLFNLIATTYGAGDGSTTFNIPDLRGYLLAGKDDMGGAAASRITAGASGIDGAVLGAAGGTQTVALLVATLPAHGHRVIDPTHRHSANDPTHAHNMSFPTGATPNVTISLFGFGDNVGAGANVATSQASATGVSLNAAATGVAVNAAGTGISIQNTGGGG